MPYDSIDQLPDSVKNHLPKHGQEIYKAAFNHASKEYNNEETAHKVAWSAVKQQYKKDTNGHWRKK